MSVKSCLLFRTLGNKTCPEKFKTDSIGGNTSGTCICVVDMIRQTHHQRRMSRCNSLDYSETSSLVLVSSTTGLVV